MFGRQIGCVCQAWSFSGPSHFWAANLVVRQVDVSCLISASKTMSGPSLIFGRQIFAPSLVIFFFGPFPHFIGRQTKTRFFFFSFFSRAKWTDPPSGRMPQAPASPSIPPAPPRWWPWIARCRPPGRWPKSGRRWVGSHHLLGSHEKRQLTPKGGGPHHLFG